MRLLSLITLFLLFSCKEKKSENAQASFFEKELISAYRFHEVNDKLVNSNELKMAPGVWASALRVSIYGNSFQRADYCLLIKRPQGLEPGMAHFTLANDFEAPCSEFLFAPPASERMEFYNLTIEANDKRLVLKVDDKNFVYPLFNDHNEWGAGISPHGPETKESGLALKDGELCQEVKSDCSMSQDLCDQCSNGSYYFVTSSCSKKFSRVCGRDNCGHRGGPACIRGEVSTGVRTYCIQDSPVGFCVGEARVACIDGKLICE